MKNKLLKYYLSCAVFVISGMLAFSVVEAHFPVSDLYDICEVEGDIKRVEFRKGAQRLGQDEPGNKDRFALDIIVRQAEFISEGVSPRPDSGFLMLITRRVPCSEAYPMYSKTTLFIPAINVLNDDDLRQSEGKKISGITTSQYKEFAEYQITEQENRNWLQRFFDWIYVSIKRLEYAVKSMLQDARHFFECLGRYIC